MPDKPAGTPLVALVVGPQGAYAVGHGVDEAWAPRELVSRFTDLTTRLGPRWVVWSAASTLRGIVAAGTVVSRTWDLAETHRVLHGGWLATPGHVLAACRGLHPDDVPVPRRGRLSGFDGDLFDAVDADAGALTREGHLRPDALARATDPARLRELGLLALECQRTQRAALEQTADGSGDLARVERSVWS
ncbi:MAG: DNA polymerase I, partial [Humibacillus sp.]